MFDLIIYAAEQPVFKADPSACFLDVIFDGLHKVRKLIGFVNRHQTASDFRIRSMQRNREIDLHFLIGEIVNLRNDSAGGNCDMTRSDVQPFIVVNDFQESEHFVKVIKSASTLGGLKRNLEAGEIVAQVVKVQKALDETDERVSSVVIMGIGEPFDNFNEMLAFLKIINHDKGLNIGARHITVSTGGNCDMTRSDVQPFIVVNDFQESEHFVKVIKRFTDSHDHD